MNGNDYLLFLVRFMRFKNGPDLKFMHDMHEYFQKMTQEEYHNVLKLLGS